jgi:hypothetical protein
MNWVICWDLAIQKVMRAFTRYSITRGPKTWQPRRLKFIVCSGSFVVFLLCFAPHLASGESASNGVQTEDFGRLVVGLSLSGSLFIGHFVPASTSDTTAILPAHAGLGLGISPLWRSTHFWAFGFSGNVTAVAHQEAGTTRWWDLQGVVRYYPSGHRRNETWFGAGAGAVAAIDSVPVHTVQPGVQIQARTYSTYAPILSLGMGFDYEISRFFSVGPGLRAVVIGTHAIENTATSTPAYGPQLGVLLDLSIAWLGPRR